MRYEKGSGHGGQFGGSVGMSNVFWRSTPATPGNRGHVQPQSWQPASMAVESGLRGQGAGIVTDATGKQLPYEADAQGRYVRIRQTSMVRIGSDSPARYRTNRGQLYTANADGKIRDWVGERSFDKGVITARFTFDPHSGAIEVEPRDIRSHEQLSVREQNAIVARLVQDFGFGQAR